MDRRETQIEAAYQALNKALDSGDLGEAREILSTLLQEYYRERERMQGRTRILGDQLHGGKIAHSAEKISEPARRTEFNYCSTCGDWFKPAQGRP